MIITMTEPQTEQGKTFVEITTRDWTEHDIAELYDWLAESFPECAIVLVEHYKVTTYRVCARLGDAITIQPEPSERLKAQIARYK